MNTAWATIIGAVVAAAASILVSYINNKKQTALIAYRLQELERRVEKHNNLVERTYRLEEKAAVLEEKQKVADHRIGDLEKKAG